MTDQERRHERNFQARLACVWEATARKVGNVHPTAGFRDAEYMTFVTSALALSWDRPAGDSSRVGGRVLQAVTETRAAAGTNTNLGIILLLVPLMVEPSGMPWRFAAAGRARTADARDAELVYEAIRVANPGGLGDTPDQDVRGTPTVTLFEAMTLAADRDMVARQYANGFADVFDFGVPAFLNAFDRFGCVEAAIIDSQMRWLAEYPDSLIARKNGIAVAQDVRRRASGVQKLGGVATAKGRAAGVALDGFLRSDGNELNPGTTADLVTASLFVALREGKVRPSAPFRWAVEDWL